MDFTKYQKVMQDIIAKGEPMDMAEVRQRTTKQKIADFLFWYIMALSLILLSPIWFTFWFAYKLYQWDSENNLGIKP